MKKLIPISLFATLMTAGAVIAQTPSPSTQPPSSTPPSPPSATEKMSPPASTSPSASADAQTMKLSADEAKAWVGKTVYSSDNKNLGEVASIERDSSGKVLELHADIGGFLGIGETRVRVLPTQFKLVNDRVVLSVGSAEAKSLPNIAK